MTTGKIKRKYHKSDVANLIELTESEQKAIQHIICEPCISLLRSSETGKNIWCRKVVKTVPHR